MQTSNISKSGIGFCVFQLSHRLSRTGGRPLGRRTVPFVSVRRDVRAGYLRQNRVRRAARQPRLRDRGTPQVRTVLPELQEGVVLVRRPRLRARQ